MRLPALILAALCLSAAPAWAQQNCPVTPAAGTSNTTCANTAFVTRYHVNKLTGPTTYYVRPNGNDSNTCLANTAAGACLTPQHALDLIAALDCANNQATVQLADGTSYPGVTVSNPFRGGCGPNGPILTGNAATPTNVALAGVSVNNGASLFVSNLQAKPSGAGISVAVSHFAIVAVSGIDWPAAAQHLTVGGGGFVRFAGNSTISGGGTCHIAATGSGSTINDAARSTTFTASVSFSEAFACAGALGAIQSAGNQYTLGAFTVTGPRFFAFNNASINTNNGGLDYYPGTTPGTQQTGGQYQ